MTIDPVIAVIGGIVVLFILAAVFGSNPQPEPEPVYTDVRATGAGHHALVRLYQGDDGYWTLLVTHTDGESFAQHLRVHDSNPTLVVNPNAFWEGVAHTLLARYDYDQSQRG
jgi:hypothetical protein